MNRKFHHKDTKNTKLTKRTGFVYLVFFVLLTLRIFAGYEEFAERYGLSGGPKGRQES
jgi:hypothetical protein